MIKLSKLRLYIILLGVIVIVGCFINGTALGTYCNFCPIGFLQVCIASRSLPTGMVIGVLIGVVIVYFLGRFFCGWLCPSTLTKESFTKKNKIERKKSLLIRNMPFIILFAALIVSFIVKFPIFCLICPIGLFFGFIFAVLKVFYSFESGWNLIIFPLMLVIEIVLFKKWCVYICPIGGFFRLVSKISIFKFRLKADNTNCLQSQGKKCSACIKNCPENVNIIKENDDYKSLCTSCMICKDTCPSKSIKW